MRLAAVRLSNFRNFIDQRLEIPEQGVAILGDNGQGKTNFLEAIYYLEIFRSFRGVADEQLIRFGEDFFRVEATVRRDDRPDEKVAAAFDRRLRKKKVTVNGAEPEKLGNAIGRVGVVIFSPSDVAIVAGSPSGRRRFLDILLSLTEPRYLEDLQRYRQILAQRNSLLRSGAAPALVSAWNAGLVTTGSRLTAARLAWIGERGSSFAAQVRRIAGGGDAVLEYESSIPREDGAAQESTSIGEAFDRELTRVAERERRQGATVVGPHRDDLRFRAAAAAGEWIDLRTYGSGGQQRTAAVALRIVEGETLRDRLKSKPIILLDDVFAELDIGRSRRILEWVDSEEGAQVILTAPKTSDLDLTGRTLAVWRIRDGVLSAD